MTRSLRIEAACLPTHQERLESEGGVGFGQRGVLDGQFLFPIGGPCAAQPASETRLLEREAGLSEVESIRGSLCQPSKGLTAAGKRKAQAADMLMAQGSEFAKAMCWLTRA